jgi:hypothetical protein
MVRVLSPWIVRDDGLNDDKALTLVIRFPIPKMSMSEDQSNFVEAQRALR